MTTAVGRLRRTVGSVTLYVLLSRLGCDTVYTSAGVTPGVWTSLPSTHNVDCTPYCEWIFYPVVHQKVLGFDYNTDKIIRSISCHCFCNTFLSQSQFSALSSTHCPAPAKCIQRQCEHQRMPNDVYSASHNRKVLPIYGADGLRCLQW